MFKKLTKFITNQGDQSADLVPVESLADNENFGLLCLLRRKPKTMFHPSPYYKRTGFRLLDVLVPEGDEKSTESLQTMRDGEGSTVFTLTKCTTDHVDGDVSFSVSPVSMEIKGKTSLSTEFSIKPQKKYILMESLEGLRRERRINMDHSFIQQLQRTHFNLYVVHETLEASEEITYKESSKADGSFKTKVYATLCTQGITERKQSIVIPKGCVLAFRPIQIIIRDGAWDLEYFQIQYSRCSRFESDGPLQGKLGEVMGEVTINCRVFSELSSHLLPVFLNAIKAVMRDRNLFQELSEKLESVVVETDVYELKTESQDLKDLLSLLKESSRDLCVQLAEAITYSLDALAELLEDQLPLLLKSLEGKIVSQQLKLVANLLEHDLEQAQKPFQVDAKLLSFPGEEEQRLTVALVRLSGVELQEDGSALPVEQCLPAVAALYVVLCVLNLLSGPA